MRHIEMKTVSIRDLHARTGAIVREAAIRPLQITDRGRVLAVSAIGATVEEARRIGNPDGLLERFGQGLADAQGHQRRAGDVEPLLQQGTPRIEGQLAAGEPGAERRALRAKPLLDAQERVRAAGKVPPPRVARGWRDAAVGRRLLRARDAEPALAHGAGLRGVYSLQLDRLFHRLRSRPDAQRAFAETSLAHSLQAHRNVRQQRLACEPRGKPFEHLLLALFVGSIESDQLPAFAQEIEPHARAAHSHGHGFRWRTLLVGLMHGMAGSAALLVLTVSQASSPAAGLGYIALFGVGSMIGMGLLSTLIAVPLAVSARWLTWANSGLQGGVGIVTIAIGIRTIAATVFV